MDIKLYHRIKEIRIANGYKSQQAFADALHVSHANVKSWENAKKPVLPRLDTLLDMCELFKCDLDYLIGNIPLSTHDISFVHDYTGLSEKAIEILNGAAKIEKQYNHPAHILVNNQIQEVSTGKTLSKIIEHDSFLEMLTYIEKLSDSTEILRYWYRNARGSEFFSPEEDDATVSMGELVQFEKESLFDMIQYKANSIFSRIISDLTDKHEKLTKQDIIRIFKPESDEETDEYIKYFKIYKKYDDKEGE